MIWPIVHARVASGRGTPVRLHEGADLDLEADQVERGAHQGVVEVEGAERAHGRQYSAAAHVGFGEPGRLLVG